MNYRPKRKDVYEQEGQRSEAVRPLTPEEMKKHGVTQGPHMDGETWWVREPGSSRMTVHFFGTVTPEGGTPLDLTSEIVLVERDGVPCLS